MCEHLFSELSLDILIIPYTMLRDFADVDAILNALAHGRCIIITF